MSGFAGRLRQRVTLLRPSAARDPLGASGEDWTVIGVVWAAVEPAGHGARFAGDARATLPVWQITARPFPVAVGDRIEWATGAIDVREMHNDPRQPDRVVAIGEEPR